MAPKPPALGSAPGDPGRSSLLRGLPATAQSSAERDFPGARGAERALRYHASMLTRRRLLAGAGVTALAFTGLARIAGGDSATAITVYKNPT
jgi:hypothetical protein